MLKVDVKDKSEKILSCLRFYYLAIKLKDIIRTGWINWNISAERRESVAEHIFGTCMLAIAVASEFKLKVDMQKSIFMLVLHETEEIIIGDIPLISNITREEKKEMGRKAVIEMFSMLISGDKYKEYVDEFEAGKTLEAKFVFLCDKLECDLQVKKYSDQGYADINNASELVKSNEKIMEIINAGAKTAGEVFIECDKYHFTGTVFEDIIESLKYTDVTKL